MQDLLDQVANRRFIIHDESTSIHLCLSLLPLADLADANVPLARDAATYSKLILVLRSGKFRSNQISRYPKPGLGDSNSSTRTTRPEQSHAVVSCPVISSGIFRRTSTAVPTQTCVFVAK
jgi:hypothetical protein